MKNIKNYEWNGFGFPIIFERLPAVKLRGEWTPDVDWTQYALPVIIYICVGQDVALSGNQVKFLRHHLQMSLREFAKFAGVTHQSVMRWEDKGKAAAQIDGHMEFVLKLKVLKHLHSKASTINQAVNKVEEVGKSRDSSYRQIKPLHISDSFLSARL